MTDELNYSDMNWCHREIESLREQLAFAMAHPTEVERTLREQVAALGKQGDRFAERLYEVEKPGGLKEQLTASQAREAKLREALEEANALNINWSSEAEPEVLAYYSEYRKVIAMGKEALAIPTDDAALKERLKEERERCAKVCEELCGPVKSVVLEAAYEECATAIRSMT